MPLEVCHKCGKKFWKYPRNYSKKQKEIKNSKTYCSRKCYGGRGRGGDEYSIFRNAFDNIKRNCKKKKWDTDITLKDLKEIFDKQNGICPYSGKKMATVYNRNPYQASLDRIDSNKPYIKDNVQFICLIAQYAKNVFSRSDVIEFCRSVTYHNAVNY